MLQLDLRSDFSSSAKIRSGPKAPGAAEKIDVFFSYPENFSRYFETNKTLKNDVSQHY